MGKYVGIILGCPLCGGEVKASVIEVAVGKVEQAVVCPRCGWAQKMEPNEKK